MMNRVLSLALFIVIGVIVAFNFKAILNFGRAHEIEQAAKKAIAAQNWEKGIQLYEEGHRQFPDNPDIALRLAWLYRKNHQEGKAEAQYRGILKSEPDHLEALLGLSNLLKNDPKRINEAITELRRALKHHPKEARLLAAIGTVYKTAAENPMESRESTKKWLYGQALYYYQHSLKLNPKQFQLQFDRGLAYQSISENENAAKAYCQALLLRPASYEARYNLGLVLGDLNYQGESYRQMERSIQLLSDQNEMDMAQDLAMKVQMVKNRVFHSNQSTLGGQEVPPFLDKACLVQPMAAEPTEKPKEDH